MPLIDHLLGHPALRKAVWKLWYPFLTRRLRNEDVVFLNYAFETDPPLAIPLSAGDERDRFCVQLYHHVGTLADIRGKNVLEISCGHGGGASCLARTFAPASYTGLDLNATGIAFCQKRHPLPGLDFVRGDASFLPFIRDSFDVVINVEASHCYPDFPGFLEEVARVLRPGGHFLYADFRFKDAIPVWEKAIADCPLEVVAMTDIGPSVIRGMELNSARSQEMLDRKLPEFLHNLGRDFAGVTGSRIHQAIKEGNLSYRSYDLMKPPALAPQA